jgi:hypothetical protein
MEVVEVEVLWLEVAGSTTVGGGGGAGSPIVTTFFGPTAPSYGTPGPAPGRYFAGGGGGWC